MADARSDDLTLRNPATGEPIGRVREETPTELRSALGRARDAQAAWGSLDVRKRAGVARAMAGVIAARGEQIASVVARSTGKTRVDALSVDVLPAALGAAYYARVAPRVLGRRRLRHGSVLFFSKAAWLEHAPYGVVGIISPWNYPFGIPMHEVVMALLAGNAVVLKVATQAQLVGEEIVAVAREAGLPADLLHLACLRGSLAGDAMIDAGIDSLCFTGSTRVGRELAAKAAARPIPVNLELGGNDAMVVLEDADLDRAAGGALWGGLSSAGQSCAGVERIYVVEPVYDAFRERLARGVASLRTGVDLDFDVDVGTLTTAEQWRKMERLLRDATERGAVVAARSRGEADAKTLVFPAVLLEEVTEEMAVMREEIFGPILALRKVRDEDEAVRRANDSVYGLSASVWTRNRRTANRVASRLAVGTVTVNDHLMSHAMAHTPWGGFRASGIGRTHGELGLEKMSQPRVVVHERIRALKRNMWWYPHGPEVYRGLLGALHALHGRGLGHRAASAARVVRLYLKSFRKG